MKTYQRITLIAVALAAALTTGAQELAPANLSSTIFNGAVTSATGGYNSAGTVSTLLASNGLDYSLGADGTLSAPVPYTYSKTGPTTATLVEGPNDGLPGVSVALTFTTATAGTFAATYTNNATQRGTFTLVPIAFSSPLANVSTRTSLAGNGSAITGFVIGGNGPRRILVRAVGPGLAVFGVGAPLANPTIMLWRGNQQIGGNDDYASGANVDGSLPVTFQRVGAFALAPNSRDAALVTTLEPGAYTAQIRGGSATETGEVLLEVYFLD